MIATLKTLKCFCFIKLIYMIKIDASEHVEFAFEDQPCPEYDPWLVHSGCKKLLFGYPTCLIVYRHAYLIIFMFSLPTFVF